jgi:Leucine-rich repeat (LRR) protein
MSAGNDGFGGQINHLITFLLSQLRYLDMSFNVLMSLPPSFSELKKLEFCVLDKNKLNVDANRMNQLTDLKKFSMRNNEATAFHTDLLGNFH